MDTCVVIVYKTMKVGWGGWDIRSAIFSILDEHKKVFKLCRLFVHSIIHNFWLVMETGEVKEIGCLGGRIIFSWKTVCSFSFVWGGKMFPSL